MLRDQIPRARPVEQPLTGFYVDGYDGTAVSGTNGKAQVRVCMASNTTFLYSCSNIVDLSGDTTTGGFSALVNDMTTNACTPTNYLRNAAGSTCTAGYSTVNWYAALDITIPPKDGTAESFLEGFFLFTP